MAKEQSHKIPTTSSSKKTRYLKAIPAYLVATVVFLFIVPSVSFLLEILLGGAIGYAAATIVTALIVLLLFGPLYIVLVKKLLVALKVTKAEEINKTQLILGCLFLFGALFWVGLAIMNSDYGIQFPTSRHLYEYDKCALKNGAGYELSTPRVWECVELNGQKIYGNF